MDFTINHNQMDEYFFRFVQMRDTKGTTYTYAPDHWETESTINDISLEAKFKNIDSNSRYSQAIYYIDGAIVYLVINKKTVAMKIAHEDKEVILGIVSQMREWLPSYVKSFTGTDVTFWLLDKNNGANSYDKKLEVPTWESISDNYTTETRRQLDFLMNYKADLGDSRGRLILWHGIPGGGKTFAIRALGREWDSWCSISYILDPENFWTSGSYLYEVALDEDNNYDYEEGIRKASGKWQLIVLEDTGELITKDSKERSGQALSRLLNIADGLLGQGSKTIFLITTNEEADALNPAVTRPGRCLAEVKFRKFDAKEAREWMTDRDYNEHRSLPGGTKPSYSLAELYAGLNGTELEEVEKVKLGFRTE